MIDDCPEYKRREVPASEILDKILQGKDVEYDCVIVKDDLDLSKLDLPTQHIKRTDLQRREIPFNEEVKLVKSKIKITNSRFEKDLAFDFATFSEAIDFSGSTFSRYVDFSGSTFSEDARFRRSTFSWMAFFIGSTFSGDADFRRSTFSEIADFSGSTFSEDARFNGSTFSGDAHFSGSTFSCNDAGLFSVFSGYEFSGSTSSGDVLTFRDAKFTRPRTQEEACRRAKNVLAKAGNRDKEEYHFYKEMEAKRIQKGVRENNGRGLKYLFFETDKWFGWKFFWYDVIEYYFVQVIFGYGVHPRRVIVSWFSVVILFSIMYWVIDGMKGGLLGTLNYLEGSFATAIAPGYIAAIINNSVYTPIYHKMAILETIIGTFLWAGFIATFAKRYMK